MVSRMRQLLLVALGGTALSSLAWGGPSVGYAQATGYYKKDTRPTLYQPLNLLDGREATCWCSTSSDPLAETLTFGFKDTAKIDEVRIYTGNGFDDRTFQEFARAKEIILKGPTGARTITVADKRGLQAVSINPPLVGARLSMELVEEYPAEDPEMPVCLTDVIFYSDGRPLNGSWLTQKLKYDKSQAPLLGTWFAGSEGAPDRFLSFFFDGTYRLVFEPFDDTVKPRTYGGTYDASSSAVVMELPGKGRVSARFAFDKRRVESGKWVRTLRLEGSGLPLDLRPLFRDQL